jgi:hypothetical protein
MICYFALNNSIAFYVWSEIQAPTVSHTLHCEHLVKVTTLLHVRMWREKIKNMILISCDRAS